VIIRKALEEDFERIYPLLQAFNNPFIDKNTYRQLFVDHWKSGEGYFGYVMFDKEQAVGFLGLIFSERIINKKTVRFCNMTSWIVREEYRGKSIFLLLPVLKLKDYIITDLTASREVYALLHKARFRDFETHYRLVFPVFVMRWLWNRPKIITDNKIIERLLDGEHLKIFHNHQSFQCRHFFVQSKEGCCYLVVSKLKRKKPPYVFAEIHYISDLSVFQRHICSITMSLCLNLCIFAVYVDNRYLEGVNVLFSKKIRLTQPRVYRCGSNDCDIVDNLYSELILLNI